VKRWFAFLALMASVLLASRADAKPDAIQIHTEAWEAYTERDGSGFAWDVIRAVYKPAGIEVDKTYVPYSRAVHNVVNGEADAWIGSYAGENSDALYPEWHYDADEIEALYLTGRVSTWGGRETLDGARVGWMRGYAYDKYLDVPVTETILNERERVVDLLERGTLRFWLDAEYEIDHIVDDLTAQRRAKLARGHVMTHELYLGFADTERGAALRRVWDERFPELLRQGRIAEIYDKWNIAFWPFEQPRDP